MGLALTRNELESARRGSEFSLININQGSQAVGTQKTNDEVSPDLLEGTKTASPKAALGMPLKNAKIEYISMAEEPRSNARRRVSLDNQHNLNCITDMPIISGADNNGDESGRRSLQISFKKAQDSEYDWNFTGFAKAQQASRL